MSYSDEQTEKQLKKLERELGKLYKDAYKEMSKKSKEYFKSFEARYEKEYQAFLEGKYTEAEFKAWEQTQIARGESWERLRDDMAKRMVNANKTASAYINDETPSVYSLNANYEAFQILQDNNMTSVAWNMVDEQEVKTLLTSGGNFTEFKTTSINPKRDYDWNSKKIQQALNAGIIQGQSLKGLANGFQGVMHSNRANAVRNARTSFTSAQNAGRVETLKRAQNMGIKVQKKWTSSGDERVRFSHMMLNGQVRDVDKPFSNGLMHPADSDGAPAEVYNCRCTLTYVYPKYENVQSNEVWDELSTEEKKAERIRYEEWQVQNAGASREGFEQFKVKGGTS